MVKIEVPEPKTKRGIATRSKIMKAAERLFGEKGYYDTSINDIATRITSYNVCYTKLLRSAA